MVQTRSVAKKTESGKVHNDNGVVTKDTPVEHPPGYGAPLPAKNRRREGSTAAPKKRRRGKPGEICQLNLDVLFLIAAYVHPIDLLNLARTCKSLRRLLMDKSSTFVWKTARRQVKGLPVCPDDLTEPEYANLVFYARCHDCGKYAPTVLWRMRRRYCLDCRIGRLCSLYSCHDVIRENDVLVTEQISIEGETTTWVDREQMESFMHEYNHSSNKDQLLVDKNDQLVAICTHAHQCEKWQRDKASERKVDLNVRRRERENSILERLKQLGYEREVTYFGSHRIKLSCKALFRKSKPLTDNEWKRIWPEWLETMNNFRSQRLDEVVYQSRRRSLASEYTYYLARLSSNTPAFDLLPHAADVAGFPPFRNIIRGPEGTQTNDTLFEFAFAQLPELVDKWRKKLDAEVAELVTIPSHLSLKASTSTTGFQSTQEATDKLRLACALFSSGFDSGLFTYPEVLFCSMRDYKYPRRDELDLERTGSIQDRYRIEYVADAPYVIHACGLDPSVATADDMDLRNARLKCLSCKSRGSHVRTWRDAVWHAHSYHRDWTAHFEPPRWQIVSDEYVAAIEAAELSLPKKLIIGYARCLICLPCVGHAAYVCDLASHLRDIHDVQEDDVQEADVQRGVHYAPLGKWYDLHSVEMVEEGGKVTFRAPRRLDAC